jgi:hypothetical protein
MGTIISLLAIFLLSIASTLMLCDGKMIKRRDNCKSKIEFKKDNGN